LAGSFLGRRGARRNLLSDLLGGGVLLLAWMLLWSWFALAMVQPAGRPASAPARAPGIHRLA
jgi:hypothetical protein